MRLEFQNITKEYHLQRALDMVSFTAQGGDIVGVVGPNGAGKTTLIKLVALLTRPSDGKIIIDGQPIGQIDRGRLGLVSPKAHLYDGLTVAENLELYAKLYRTKSGYWKECAEYFNLTGFMNKLTRELSHGQKRRASLARIMLGDPEILLLDEPFLGLDIEATEEVKNLISGFQQEGRLVIIATHHFEIATNIINRLLVLDHGKLIDFDKFSGENKSLTDFYNGLFKRKN